jgi:hypothetical protein
VWTGYRDVPGCKQHRKNRRIKEKTLGDANFLDVIFDRIERASSSQLQAVQHYWEDSPE